MSRRKELAAQNTARTAARWFRPGEIEIEDASVLWYDFDGSSKQHHRPEDNGRDGYVDIILTPAMFDMINQYCQDRGAVCVIHEDNVYSDEELQRNADLQQVSIKFIDVKINMFAARPPVVNHITKLEGQQPQRTVLNGAEVGRLNKAMGNLECMDLRFRLYVNPNSLDKESGKPRCSFYLTNAYVTEAEQKLEYSGKYRPLDIDETDANGVTSDQINNARN